MKIESEPAPVILGNRFSTPDAFGGCCLIDLPPYKAAPLVALGVPTSYFHSRPFAVEIRQLIPNGALHPDNLITTVHINHLTSDGASPVAG